MICLGEMDGCKDGITPAELPPRPRVLKKTESTFFGRNSMMLGKTQL